MQGGEAAGRRRNLRTLRRYRATVASGALVGVPLALFQRTMHQAQCSAVTGKLDSLKDKMSHITDERRILMENAVEGTVEDATGRCIDIGSVAGITSTHWY